MRPYRNTGIGGAAASRDLVRALQDDLRALGYLRRGIDGGFGEGTRAAIRALQYDLLNNHGAAGSDGTPPVAVSHYNRGVAAITGIADAAFSDSVEAALNDPVFPKLPRSTNPRVDNASAVAAIAGLRGLAAPAPYLLAIFQQESNREHFAVSPPGDEDSYVIVGLDRNDKHTTDHITSRGYGIGQYTLFHHPPTAAEIARFVLDPIENVHHAANLLADKFNTEVVGPNGADDRAVEHKLTHLLPCRYGVADARHMADCRSCALATPKLTITPATPLFAGSTQTYGQANQAYYPHPNYGGVPNRALLQCDWPYATRRYNGGGPNSFNYQAIVLKNLLGVPGATKG
jgi:hypothetical protein